MTSEIVLLSDIATIERDGIEADAIPSGTRYVGLENIESGGRSLSYDCVSAGQIASTKFRFSEEHVLFGKLRPYLGKIARPSFSGVCSTDILPIRPGPRLDSGYLAHFLLQPQTIEWANSRSTGVNLPRLSPKQLENLEIPLPAIDEQRRIATLLDKADVLRRKRKRALELIRSFVKSIFLDMFGDADQNKHKLPIIQLDSVIADGPNNGLYKPSSAYGSGCPILRINNFYNGEMDELEYLRRLEISEPEISKFELRKDDIVINRVNSREHVGKSALIPCLPEKVVYESNIMRLRVQNDIARPEFVIHSLQTECISKQIQSKAKDAINQSSINQSDVRSLQMPLPSIKDQDRFVRVLIQAGSMRSFQQSHEARIDSLHAALRHQLFAK